MPGRGWQDVPRRDGRAGWATRCVLCRMPSQNSEPRARVPHASSLPSSWGRSCPGASPGGTSPPHRPDRAGHGRGVVELDPVDRVPDQHLGGTHRGSDPVRVAVHGRFGHPRRPASQPHPGAARAVPGPAPQSHRGVLRRHVPAAGRPVVPVPRAGLRPGPERPGPNAPRSRGWIRAGSIRRSGSSWRVWSWSCSAP